MPKFLDELDQRVNDTVFQAMRAELPAMARQVEHLVREGLDSKKVRAFYAAQPNILPWLLDAIEIAADKFRSLNLTADSTEHR